MGTPAKFYYRGAKICVVGERRLDRFMFDRLIHPRGKIFGGHRRGGI